ncbi:MAG: GNAT family N-acetyltransferase [Candidatus Doudnabacteria bacterium]|jgi:ribosomal protein S18 acetylase RimI-like enzyme
MNHAEKTHTELNSNKSLDDERFRSTKGFLFKEGILTESSGVNQVDVARIKVGQLNYQRATRLSDGSKLSAWDTIQVLSTLEGVDQDASAQSGENKPVPVIALPRGLKDLQNGEYVYKARMALLQPWEVAKKFYNWDKPIVLQDGNITNSSELALVKALSDLQAKRNEKGGLEIYDEKAQKYVKFSGAALKRLTGMIFGGSADNIYMNPRKFAKEHLQNLLALEIIKSEDFTTLSGSQTADQYGQHERSSWSEISPYIYLTNSKGQGAKYYMGRTKLPGLNTEIDHKNMSVKLLAPDLVGVIKTEESKQKIIATLDLAQGEEIEKVRNREAVRLRQKGGKVSPTLISQGSTFGVDYSKEYLKSYSITNFLRARLNEKPEDYFKRIRILDNQEEVIKQLKVFEDLGVSMQNLPWAEQLMLCRIALEDQSAQRQSQLRNFARTYGIAGLRTFISLDYDRSLGGRILDIGEKLEKPLVVALFKKYGEIVDCAYQAKAYLDGHFFAGTSESENLSQKLIEGLLKKGKDLLSEFSPASENKQLDSVELINRLEAVKTEVLLFAQAFKVLPKEAKVEFEDIANTSIEDRDSASLTEEEKKQMTEIFTLNRLGNYPEKLLKQTQKDFTETLNTPGHTFRMLVHQGRLVAFLHYDRISGNEIYVGSLNLHPSAKDSPIAIAMLKAALEEKGGENKLKAIVWQNNPAGRFYKMLGFKETGQIENYENTGEVYLQLERSPSQDTQIHEIKKAA